VEEGPRRTTTIQAYILNGGFGSTGENQKGGLSFFWEKREKRAFPQRKIK
jgi:outer membrane biogenesis lipoprotein LolB